MDDNVVIGMFDDNDEAAALIGDLEGHGIPRDHITVERSQAPTERHDPRGFFQKLGDLLSGRDSRALAEGVRRGATVVSVRVGDLQIDEAAELMRAHGAVDIDERTEGWRQEGWADESARPERQAGPVLTEEQRVPVVEEELRVGKREVQRGGVRVYTRVRERPVEEQIRLREEHVMVDRRPVDEPVSSDQGVFREGTVEVTERAEEAVVAKEARVVEEVVVGKEVQERIETIRDTVRRTDVDVQPIELSAEEFGRYDADFREHFRSVDPLGSLTYDQYLPAYQYGWRLAERDPYRGRSWNDIEAGARGTWEPDHPNTWDRFKDAIRYGWERRVGSTRS